MYTRSSWTMMLPFHPGLAYVAAYGGRGMCAGTSLSGLTVAAFICGLLSRPLHTTEIRCMHQERTCHRV